MLFENKQLIIKYIENDNKDGYYDFSVEIKDFDTPNINLKFDYDKGKIVTMWIDIYEDENEPKNHVVYKLFDLCKYNYVCKDNFNFHFNVHKKQDRDAHRDTFA